MSNRESTVGLRRRLEAVVAGMIVSAFAASAAAAVPENYQKMWDGVARQIDEGIERHRKTDSTIEVVDACGRPIPGARWRSSRRRTSFVRLQPSPR